MVHEISSFESGSVQAISTVRDFIMSRTLAIAQRRRDYMQSGECLFDMTVVII